MKAHKVNFDLAKVNFDLASDFKMRLVKVNFELVSDGNDNLKLI